MLLIQSKLEWLNKMMRWMCDKCQFYHWVWCLCIGNPSTHSKVYDRAFPSTLPRLPCTTLIYVLCRLPNVIQTVHRHSASVSSWIWMKVISSGFSFSLFTFPIPSPTHMESSAINLNHCCPAFYSDKILP